MKYYSEYELSAEVLINNHMCGKVRQAFLEFSPDIRNGVQTPTKDYVKEPLIELNKCNFNSRKFWTSLMFVS